jgi:hypothetical protein
MTARVDSDAGGVKFLGWSRMALPIQDFTLTKVGKPKVGTQHPSVVLGSLKYSLQKFAVRSFLFSHAIIGPRKRGMGRD